MWYFYREGHPDLEHKFVNSVPDNEQYLEKNYLVGPQNVFIRFPLKTPHKDWSGSFTPVYYKLLEKDILEELEEFKKNNRISEKDMKVYHDEVIDHLGRMESGQATTKFKNRATACFVLLCLDIMVGKHIFGRAYFFEALMWVFSKESDIWFREFLADIIRALISLFKK
jgi:hypothetical protein